MITAARSDHIEPHGRQPIAQDPSSIEIIVDDEDQTWYGTGQIAHQSTIRELTLKPIYICRALIHLIGLRPILGQ